jgi:hypothetical protein
MEEQVERNKEHGARKHLGQEQGIAQKAMASETVAGESMGGAACKDGSHQGRGSRSEGTVEEPAEEERTAAIGGSMGQNLAIGGEGGG